MHRLLAGYARFRTTVLPGLAPQLEKLAHGQHPEALLITCSDSRVMPEMILQSEPGEVFPVRVAGNFIPLPGEDASGIAGSIEYAVRVLKVREAIVCGHTACGAIKELLEQAHREDLPQVTQWLDQAGVSARWLRAKLSENEALSAEQRIELMTEANVLAQLDRLAHHAAVGEAMRSGALRLHGWMYDIASGEVRAFDPETGRFDPLPTHEAEEKKVA